MTTTTAYVYRLPLPPKGSGSNARSHWAQRSRVAREYRAECTDAYLAQGVPPAPLEWSHVEVEMRVCRRRVPERHPGPGAGSSLTYYDWLCARDRYRPRDAGNVLDACKAALDALQPERLFAHRTDLGAGVVVGDDAQHLTVGAPRLVEVATFAEEGVWVTVREVGE